MNKIYQFLVSTSFMGFLLLIMAFSMAIATFIESSYGTPAAKALVYNTHWFELVFLLLGISLIHNFFKYRQFTAKKLTIGIFHLSFIVILIGAGITRYISFEGMMHIREGASADYIVSTDSYFTVETDQQKLSDKVLFSELSAKEFSGKLTIEGEHVRVKSVGFVKDAVGTPVETESGDPVVDFVISAGQGMESFTFGKGQLVNLGPATVGFEGQADVRFEQEGAKLFVVADRDMEIRSMAGGEPEQVPAGTRSEVKLMHLYAFDGYLVLVKKFYEHASLRVSKSGSGDTGEDAVIVEISNGERQAIVNVFGRAGQIGAPVTYMIGQTPVKLTYGSQPVKLPFRLRLKDFQLERYIGSESPSSFASEIELIDDERNVQRDVRIFMNNTLKYRGFRFYQSSYDQDELGTILSVNKDFWGTLVTYIGYFLLTVGMILSLGNKNSYFQVLVRHLKQSSKIKFAGLFLGLMLLGGAGQAQSTAGIPRLDEELVSDFSELWVHGHDGRIEPMSTLSSEILRKLSRKSSLNGMSPDEVVLSMNLYPELWRSIPFIKIDKEIAASIGVREKYARIIDLFDLEGNYRITEQVRAAFAKAPALRNKLDKEYIFLDERINISFMVFKGDLLTFFPPVNQTDAWWAVGSTPTGYPANDSLFVNRSFNLLAGGIESEGGEIQPRQIIATIAAFQQKFGAEILPSAQKKSAEMVYNKYQPFKRVFPWYLLTGFILLAILFVNIFRQKPIHRVTRITFSGLIYLGFAVHTIGLIVRWYISGRAPWSNGYESMIYVAWAAMLAGIIFGRKYPMVLGTAAVLTGITLFVAHLNWMNPEITPLVPVLKSYWLMIHVSIITASYGFLGLSAFLGILVLVLYALMNRRNQKNIDYFIDQLTTISELSATIGLYMLTIGTFLGGVWANESWGRYWGWDPKETWALITAVIYAFIVHMRLIPSLRGRYNYNLATVIAFTSVLMTYFGVNYFLSGLHSYGKGSADGIHWAVYVSFGLITVLALWSYSQYKKYEAIDE
ncbi:c-type cytochrome biogenesis protein CcsB [uncultured Sunxiuqinia sp.]|uniref:c-type cytochrome biogenesis protein CcsB n=1 Tax=uncultured Sunxiuqinia sp. TaxID=1573825 RepID=UPI00260D4C58|nr:c-type cytochrome biogenesis protein CcsB [uncultured Sunxiuqinia sp.]